MFLVLHVDRSTSSKYHQSICSFCYFSLVMCDVLLLIARLFVCCVCGDIVCCPTADGLKIIHTTTTTLPGTTHHTLYQEWYWYMGYSCCCTVAVNMSNGYLMDNTVTCPTTVSIANRTPIVQICITVHDQTVLL